MANPSRVQSLSLARRQQLLIDSNVRPLRQMLDLLERIGDLAYSEPAPGFEPHRAGGHVRHILDFYECFLDGLVSRRVDYEARKRDESVERSREAAASRIRSIIRRLEDSRELRGDSIVRVRMEEGGDLAVSEFLTSSPARELQALASHTIHHCALIGMTLLAHGVAVDPDFGMAPSTMRYRASIRQRRAQAGEAA